MGACQQPKAVKQLHTSSHMLKHILEEHGEDEIDNVEFGAKVIRYTRNAFERQVIESVIIQEERGHHILNSKSEYNRCSLPRLTAKLGERDWKKRDKEGEEEKEKEKQLEKRIIEMRKKRNNPRRDDPSQKDQPSQKRRKLGENEWKSVMQEKEPAEKRKQEEKENKENNEKPKAKKRKVTILDYIRESEEKEEEAKEDQDSNIRYGSYETGEMMEEDFWDKYLAKRSSEMEAAEEERRKRLEKAKRQERSWELMRVIRDYIEEVKANSWFRNKEIRRVRERAESEKRERLERASMKKEELGKRIEVQKRQQNLIEMMKKLPSKEQEAIEIEERKMKRLELQEIKENLWRKWRGKKDTRDSKVENEDEI